MTRTTIGAAGAPHTPLWAGVGSARDVRLVPDTLIAGRYRVRHRIAGGGMGEVWVADDERLGREVAVKVVRPDLAEDGGFRARFEAEARSAAGLAHPGVVAVHDYGEEDGQPFIVMELVAGESLAAALLSAGRLGVERTLDVVSQAGEALQAAHDAGVVHRDVKPANLLLRADGRVQVTDFGTARALGAAAITVPGAMIGTPQYVAPEQVDGGGATAAGDVFALGVVAYECLAGRRPFEGDSVAAVVVALLHADPPALPPDVPPAVAELVLACLVKDPAARIATAREVAARARALLPPETPVPPPAPAPPAASPPPAPPAPAPASAPAPGPAPPPASPPPPASAPPPAPQWGGRENREHAPETSTTPLRPRDATVTEARARRRRTRTAAVAVLLVTAVAAVAIGLLTRGGGDEAGTPPTPTAGPTTGATATPGQTTTATPATSQTPTATPSPTVTPTATATPVPADRRTASLIGDPAASVVRTLRRRGYRVTLSFSASTAGAVTPGTVYAIDPSPLPPAGGRVRVIAQPTG